MFVHRCTDARMYKFIAYMYIASRRWRWRERERQRERERERDVYIYIILYIYMYCIMHSVQSGPENCLRNSKFLQKYSVQSFSFSPLKLCFSWFPSSPTGCVDWFRNWWRIIWEIPWPTPWPSFTAGGLATSWSGATQTSQTPKMRRSAGAWKMNRN